MLDLSITSFPRALKSVALAAGVILGGVSGAHALPIFSLNPAAVGLTGAAFTADNIILSDFATATITPNGSGGGNFVERGTLAVTAFQLGSSFVSTPALNSTYGLYFSFSAAGTQTTPTFGPGTTGTFTSLTYSLFGFNRAPGDTITFNPSNTTPTSTGGPLSPILLATGSLLAGAVGETLGVPNANTILHFAAGAGGFFQSPVPFYNAQFAAFTNNPSQVAIAPGGGSFVITAGGGSANFFNVPEPVSMTVFGVGLAGTMLARRRRQTV